MVLLKYLADIGIYSIIPSLILVGLGITKQENTKPTPTRNTNQIKLPK